ncbi:hypothetical protein LTR10_010433 [Elasticomyces elasticus]|nr:hypothetical protein LTR10_010433 [Elasticomyces elasticus]KAK4972333.1 hypothetical protein LTR42_006841 [Elasticomyces elasticus]
MKALLPSGQGSSVSGLKVPSSSPPSTVQLASRPCLCSGAHAIKLGLDMIADHVAMTQISEDHEVEEA